MIKAPKHWSQTGVVSLALYPFSIVYGISALISRGLISQFKASVPVICVGNIVVGGAGKTPIALEISTILKNLGKNPHVVSRGYGGTASGPILLDNENPNPKQSGDEPILLARVVPTWVSKNRMAGVVAASEKGCDIIVLDDGLQNPSVIKDLSIVVVDGGFGFGNKMLLPAGPLRQSISSGISQAQIAIIIGDDEFNAASDIKKANPNIKILQASMVPQAAEHLKNSDVVAFAGIGRPEKFFETLAQMGCNIKSTQSFADHHNYIDSDISKIIKLAEKNNATVVTTEKDAVKIPPHWLNKITVLKVGIKWHNQDAQVLEKILTELVGGGN